MQKVKKELLDTAIDMALVERYRQQFADEDYEKLVQERPSNLYLATRIRGIRETTIHALAFLTKGTQTD